MSNGWEGVEKDIDSGPRGFFGVAVKAVLWIVALAVVIGLVGIPLGLFNETKQVAQEQFGPRASLVKYEWFKNTSAQLDKKKADISLYETQMKDLKSAYGANMASWPRDAREEYNQSSAEYRGVVAAFNQLAAEYNANSSKFNWSYAEGDAPKVIEPYKAQ